jgi:hypothetical protein
MLCKRPVAGRCGGIDRSRTNPAIRAGYDTASSAAEGTSPTRKYPMNAMLNTPYTTTTQLTQPGHGSRSTGRRSTRSRTCRADRRTCPDRFGTPSPSESSQYPSNLKIGTSANTASSSAPIPASRATSQPVNRKTNR